MQPAAADDKIYLVMGGSEIHYYISLGWALQNVPLHKTVVLVYIFRPAFDIPMLCKELMSSLCVWVRTVDTTIKHTLSFFPYP